MQGAVPPAGPQTSAREFPVYREALRSCLDGSIAFLWSHPVCYRSLHRLFRYQVYMTYMYFSFFFIPIFKWNRRFFVEMSCCGAVYELDPEVGKRLLRGEEVEITESDLTLRQDGNGNPWTGSDASHRHKVCPSCGFETDEDFSYCPQCGKPL